MLNGALTAGEKRVRDTSASSATTAPVAGMSGPVAVLYSAAEVTRFLASGLEAAAVLPLSPSAELALRCSDLPRLSLHERFSDYRFAKAMVRIERARRQLDAATAEGGVLNEAGKWALRYSFAGIALSAIRLSEGLGKTGPWTYPDADGWKTSADRDEVRAGLIRHIIGSWTNFEGRIDFRDPPAPALFRRLRRLALAMVPRRRVALLVPRSDHPLGLRAELEAQAPAVRQFHVSPAERGWLEYSRLLRELLRAWSGAFQVQVRSLHAADLRLEAAVADAVAAVSDPDIRAGLTVLLPGIQRRVAAAHGAVADMRVAAEDIGPNLFLAYEVADSFAAALADAAGQAGISRLIVNHNTHVPTASPIGNLGVRETFLFQHPPEMADLIACWTPQTHKLAQELIGSGTAKPVLPLRRLQPPLAPRPAAGPRVVLHAGNVVRWFHHFRWIFENSDEWVDGLAALTRAANALPDLRLVIRSKFRVEADQAALRQLLPVTDRIEIKSNNSGPFLDDLAAADLLVSFSSTTIFEALQARKPVLLWGGTNRYRRLPARTAPPTPGDRTAVYTVTEEARLAPMIEAILEAHSGRPLTDDEVRDYVWLEDVPGVDELARAIASGDVLRPWKTRRLI